MSNPRYLAGRRFEYKIKKILESMNFTCFRTAGSHGCVDIIAVNSVSVRMIQCKYVKDAEKKTKAILNQCRNEFNKYNLPEFALKEVHIGDKTTGKYEIYVLNQ